MIHRPLHLAAAACIFFCITILACASRQYVALDKVPRNRTYNTDVGSVIDAVRLYSIRESYRLASADKESGRVVGRKETSGRGSEGPNSITMILRVTRSAEGGTSVEASFTYLRLPTSISKDEESQLAEQYISLFDLLDSQFR